MWRRKDVNRKDEINSEQVLRNHEGVRV
jgi:hypothetical protein